jgi:photosystem II stability/assembly factor-like uncharacterized protein
LAAVGPLPIGGHGWVKRGSTGECLRSFVSDPSNPSVVYGHSYRERVYRSTDGGWTWASFPGPSEFWVSLLVSPVDSSMLYAVAQGFYVSRDSGVSWERSLSAPPYLNGPLVQDPFDPATMYVSTSCCFGSGHFFPEVWVTTDAGVHWSLRNAGLTQGGNLELIGSLIAHPREPGVLLASLTTGVFQTVDQGRHWMRLSETELALAGFASETNLVWAVNSETVLRSLDGGRSWSPVEIASYPETVTTEVTGLVPDPERSNTSYAAVDTEFAGFFFTSTIHQTWDAGENWTVASGLPLESEGSVRGLSALANGSLWVSVCGDSNSVYVMDFRGTREIDPR